MLTDYTIDGFENIKYQGFSKLKKIEEKLLDLFTSFGYVQVETPTFESYDFYCTDNAIRSEDLFKLVSSSGKVLALKPDATLPITRMAAINHHDPEEIIKFCYQTNIYKDFAGPERVKKETTQAGIEYFGKTDYSCDAEIIALAIQSLLRLGLKNIHIDIGHVGFINALLDELYLPAPEREQLFSFIENKNLGDIRVFLDGLDIPEDKKQILLKLPRLYGEPEEVLKEMKELALNPKMKRVLKRLEDMFKSLDELGYKDFIHFDIGFTNRMNYYTGMIFKGYIGDYGETVISGGRYDALSRRFGIDRPACGFSIDLILLLDYLEQKDLIQTEDPQSIIFLYTDEDRNRTFELVHQEHKKGNQAEMFLIQSEPEKFFHKLLKNSHYKKSQVYYVDGENLRRLEEDQIDPLCFS